MFPVLEEIQQFVQHTAEIISSVLSLEIVITNADSKVIAGTGNLEREIGFNYGENSLSGDLLRSKNKYHIIRDTRKYPICKKCSRRKECQYLSVLVSSINLDDRTIGVLGITATTLEQKTRLLNNINNLYDFTDKISVLLSSVIEEKKSKARLSRMNCQFNSVIDSVSEGIIAIDNSGFLTHINKAAQNMIGLNKKQSIGKSINYIFSNIDMDKLSRQDNDMMDNTLTCKINRIQYVSNINQILHGDREIGYVFSIKPMKEKYRTASRLMGYEANITFDRIIGSSHAFSAIKNKMERVALTDSTIFIQGESGTGKDLFARAIHEHSTRRNKPFVSINCAAIPETLLESELFGYEEGAFTGAKRGGKPGKFEIANGGTIFLDEIGDMPIHLQSKLLKVLEQRYIERIGGINPIPINIRFISATLHDLEDKIKKLEFRADLYYRLSVIPILIPPLRERREDIELLVKHFFQKHSKILGKKYLGISSEAMNLILGYKWPGNVRELENAIEYALNIETESIIQPESLPHKIKGKAALEANDKVVKINDYLVLPKEKISVRDLPSIKVLEKDLLRFALNKFGSSVESKKKISKALDISLRTLYNRLS